MRSSRTIGGGARIGIPVEGAGSDVGSRGRTAGRFRRSLVHGSPGMLCCRPASVSLATRRLRGATSWVNVARRVRPPLVRWGPSRLRVALYPPCGYSRQYSERDEGATHDHRHPHTHRRSTGRHSRRVPRLPPHPPRPLHNPRPLPLRSPMRKTPTPQTRRRIDNATRTTLLTPPSRPGHTNKTSAARRLHGSGVRRLLNMGHSPPQDPDRSSQIREQAGGRPAPLLDPPPTR